MENRKTGYNRRLAKKRVQCLNEAFCFVSSLVLADSLVLRKPLLRQAPKRYEQTQTQNLIFQTRTKSNKKIKKLRKNSG